MEVLCRNAVHLMQNSPSPQLFNSGPARNKLLEALSHEYMYRDVFYGKLHGFQVMNYPTV